MYREGDSFHATASVREKVESLLAIAYFFNLAVFQNQGLTW
jgi:hypothetical protein